MWFIIIPLQFFVVELPDNKKYGWLGERILILCYIEELIRMMVADCVTDHWEAVTDNQLNLAGNLAAILVIGVVCRICRAGRKRWDFFYQERYRWYMRNGIILAVGFVAVIMIGCAVELHYVTDVLKDISPNLMPNLRGKEVSLLAMLGIGVLMIFVTYIKNSNERIEELLKENQDLRQREIGYYESRLKQEEETRDYRHDMDGQIRWMLELLNEGDMQKLKECLTVLYGNLMHIRKRIFYTGNRVLDAVLHSYISELDESVAVTITGRCDCELLLSDRAWCTICSNLIHNAVEYLNQCTANHRFLKIKMETGKNNFEMEIINFIEEDALSFGTDGKLLTTKKDKKNHGIGLKNVERTVRANHGMFEYHVKKQSFCCTVLLDIKK